MSKKCPECESRNIHITHYPAPTDSMATCYSCGYADLLERFPEQTVFDKITESVETLAEKLVYHIYLTDCMQRKRSYWRSTFFPCNNFSTKEKAIAATVEKLKEVYDAKRH